MIWLFNICIYIYLPRKISKYNDLHWLVKLLVKKRGNCIHHYQRKCSTPLFSFSATTCISVLLPPGGTVSQVSTGSPALIPPLLVSVISQTKSSVQRCASTRNSLPFHVCALSLLSSLSASLFVAPLCLATIRAPLAQTWGSCCCCFFWFFLVFLLPCTLGPPHSAPLLEGVARRPRWQSHCPRSLSL